jgi:hypothetical protein
MISRNYSSVSLRSKILENTGHSGTKSETFGRGMQYVFEKPKLNLDAAVLNKYVDLINHLTGTRLISRMRMANLLYTSPPLINTICTQPAKLISIQLRVFQS